MATIRPNAEPAATTVVAGDIFLIDGSTGVRALAASVVPLLDANGNVSINNVTEGFASTATAAGTTTLTVASAAQQFFTGTTTQTVVLPVVSTLKLGAGYFFQNSSTGAITIQSSGGGTVKVLAPGTFATITCIAITGTSAASWQATYFADIVVSGKVLTLSNSLTLAGTDGTTMTFPTTSATLARTDAAQTFTGTQAFGALTATTLNGNTFTAGTGVLTIAAAKTLTASNSLTLAGTDGKTLTVSNSLALAGTDGTTQTFPSTSGTVVTSVSSNAVTNAMRAQMTAATLKGNVTASTANEADFTIQGLVNLAAPSSTLDFIPIYDHVSGTIKSATPGAIASAAVAGVSSIAGNTGAFTLGDGLTHATNVLSADFTDFLGFISGLTLSTTGGSSTFAIAPGVAVDIAGGGVMKLTSGTFTKTMAAWAVGSANGAFDGTGTAPTAASFAWYHVHLIKRTDTGVVDVLISASATAPTLPSPYTLFRRIGAMKTDASFHWTLFTQNGNEFLWASPILELSNVTVGTSASTQTLNVPTGVKVNAILNGYVTNAAVAQLYLSSLDQTDISPPFSTGQVPSAGAAGTVYANIRTSTSAQIRARAGAASTTINIGSSGWIDWL